VRPDVRPKTQTIIIGENGTESRFPYSEQDRAIPMKAKLHTIDCDEEDLIELPESWIPVRLEHNGYSTPSRKAYTLFYLERA